MNWIYTVFLALLLVQWLKTCMGTTSASDLQVLQSFYKGVNKKASLSNWGNNQDPCGNNWKYIKCTGSSVTALEMSGLGLGGTVTPDINKLESLVSVQLQGNGFTGSLPSLSGLSSLTSAYFGGNNFDTIPGDFFSGLSMVTEIFMEDSHLNVTQGPGGWSLPDDTKSLIKLVKLSLGNTSLVGNIPDFLGEMPSLKYLYLAYNKLHGSIPASFATSGLIEFQINNQQGEEHMVGPIDPVAGMQSLSTLWLHVNQFSGVIPSGLGSLSSLQDLRLNDNMFVGTIPDSLAQLKSLKNMTIKGNKLVGSMPKLSFAYDGDTKSNGFCQATPGVPCDPRVTALFTFIGAANGFSSPCTTSWQGNDPCKWIGISCGPSGSISSIRLPKCQLSGNISDSLAQLNGLTTIQLPNNRITGLVPDALAKIPTLKTLDLFNNSLAGPVPTFPSTVQLNVTSNPLGPATGPSTSPAGQVPGTPQTVPDTRSNKKKTSPAAVAFSIVAGIVVLGIIVTIVYCICTKRGGNFMRVPTSSSPLVVHPREDDTEMVPSSAFRNKSNNKSGPSEIRVEIENLVIPIQTLRKATNGFSERSVLGRGGFGVVYLGELDDGTKVAVKRMESAMVNNTGLAEFQSEIKVLSKVRHKHLVALLGYCIEGREKLLVYEYMPQGNLSQHLFEYAIYNVVPLTWKQRLSIALDVARAMEYLHGLAQQRFIHRDLKPSNILLDDDLRAKVADFGLVKLAPEGKYSIETRIAGTFGYLAPEYAETGRVTTKADVYSFGVILMELLTGSQALDTSRPEESVHLTTSFRRVTVDFKALFDPKLELKGEEESQMNKVAELARQCVNREPYHRPDMSYVVNVLAPMVMRWKPSVDMDAEDNGGMDFGGSLSEAMRWADITQSTFSQSSIPNRPTGFADTFSASDVR